VRCPLAGFGNVVTGIDLSPAMIAYAETKAPAAQQRISFRVMDAAFPVLAPEQFELIVCRHLLWALPDMAGVLRRWVELLKPGGCLLLIEGYWSTGGGLHASEIMKAVPAPFTNLALHNLSTHPEYWGGEVVDERYAIIAYLRQSHPNHPSNASPENPEPR
jgi:SAM-dependent methyltransferase